MNFIMNTFSATAIFLFNLAVQTTSVPIYDSNSKTDPEIERPGQLFEGDISGVDLETVVAGNSSTIGKNGVINEQLHWPKATIPFLLSDVYTADQKETILNAMQGFNRTCVRFVPWTNEIDYIRIAPGFGCWSSIGRISGKQGVSVGPGCITAGVVQHELMHAVGFYHEQSRLDRDNYVEINHPNILPSDETQFLKYFSNAFNQPYDFGSVMHYGDHDFAKDKDVWTIRPRPPYTEKKIGQRDGLSEIDIKKINKMYKCPKSPAVLTTTTELTTTADADFQIEDINTKLFGQVNFEASSENPTELETLSSTDMTGDMLSFTVENVKEVVKMVKNSKDLEASDLLRNIMKAKFQQEWNVFFYKSNFASNIVCTEGTIFHATFEQVYVLIYANSKEKSSAKNWVIVSIDHLEDPVSVTESDLILHSKTKMTQSILSFSKKNVLKAAIENPGNAAEMVNSLQQKLNEKYSVGSWQVSAGSCLFRASINTPQQPDSFFYGKLKDTCFLFFYNQ